MKLRTRLRRTSRSKRNSSRSAHGGQALVEFAVIGLILATMSFGVIEFGRAYYAAVAVTNASRDGARVAMDPSKSDADIIAAAEESAGSVELTSIDISRSTTVGDTNTITATYAFTSTLPIISQFWGGGELNISHSSTSRVGWEW